MSSTPEPKFTDPRLTPPSQELRSISASGTNANTENKPTAKPNLEPAMKTATSKSMQFKPISNEKITNQVEITATQTNQVPPSNSSENLTVTTDSLHEFKLSPEERLNRFNLRFKLFNYTFAIVVLFLFSDALISLPIFQLRTLEYVGLKQVSAKDLELKLDLDHLSPSLLQPKLSAIEERISSHPWIQSVEASITWQGHIQIELVEHQATAIAVLDELKVVNSDGLPFASISPSEANNLPLISGLPPEMFNHSQKERLIGQYWLSQGIELARLIKSLGLDKNRKLSDIHISRTGRYEVMLDKIRVSLGLDMLKERLIEVERILNQLDRKGVNAAYILLSDDLNRAIVKEIPITADDAEVVE